MPAPRGVHDDQHDGPMKRRITDVCCRTSRPSTPAASPRRTRNRRRCAAQRRRHHQLGGRTRSPIGYFAVIYKRVTLAIRKAINEGEFDDGRRVGELDVAFAKRYFNALNAYFHPDQHRGLTLPWEVAFVGDQDGQAIILQHMMAGSQCTHQFRSGHGRLSDCGSLAGRDLKNDYNRVNVILCAQMPGILKVVDQLSPDLRASRWLVPGEVGVLKRALTKLRKGLGFSPSTWPCTRRPRGERHCTRRLGRRR